MASEPSKYFNDPRGDLFLLSSDNHAFTVNTVIIGMASETFGAMLGSGVLQPKGEEDGTLQRPLVLDAPAEVLDIVFRFIYPGSDASIDLSKRADLILPVALFGQKYLLDGLLMFLQKELTRIELRKPAPLGQGWDSEVGPVIPVVSQSIIEQDPLRAYAIVAVMEWSDLTDLIQDFVYRLDLLRGACKLSQEWDLLRPSQYHDLVAHYSRVRDAAIKLADDFVEGVPRLEEEVLSEEGLSTVEIPWYYLEPCVCNDIRPTNSTPKRRNDKKGRYFEVVPPSTELSSMTAFKAPHWLRAVHRYLREDVLDRAAKPPARFLSSPDSQVRYIIEKEAAERCWGCSKHLQQNWLKILELEAKLERLV